MAMVKEEILEAIKGLSVLDLAELVKSLEEEFGVSAAAPVMMSTVQGVAGTSEAAAAEVQRAASGDWPQQEQRNQGGA